MIGWKYLVLVHKIYRIQFFVCLLMPMVRKSVRNPKILSEGSGDIYNLNYFILNKAMFVIT